MFQNKMSFLCLRLHSIFLCLSPSLSFAVYFSFDVFPTKYMKEKKGEKYSICSNSKNKPKSNI